MTIRSLSQANSDPSNSPRPEQPTEIPDIPPAIVPEQQPDVLPEPLGPDIPDRPDPAPDVPMPEQMPPPPDSPGQPALSLQKRNRFDAVTESMSCKTESRLRGDIRPPD